MLWQQWSDVNSMNSYYLIIFQELGLKGDQASCLALDLGGRQARHDGPRPLPWY